MKFPLKKYFFFLPRNICISRHGKENYGGCLERIKKAKMRVPFALKCNQSIKPTTWRALRQS